MLFEWDSLRHQIFIDGRKHDETLGPLWMGDSIGHWEGDTLVADTVNFNDKTWLDRIGHPHSDQLHVIERIRRVDHEHLQDDITIDDPKAYTKPWTGRIDFRAEAEVDSGRSNSARISKVLKPSKIRRRSRRSSDFGIDRSPITVGYFFKSLSKR